MESGVWDKNKTKKKTGGTMETGLSYFEGHSEDFTLFSEMCVNLQKIQDIKITNCTAIITANVLHTVANDSVTYVVDVKALPFFSN